jgi:hypothetical protein
MGESDKHTLKAVAVGAVLAAFAIIGSGFGWTLHAQRNPATAAAIACKAGYIVRSEDPDVNCRTLIESYAP